MKKRQEGLRKEGDGKEERGEREEEGKYHCLNPHTQAT